MRRLVISLLFGPVHITVIGAKTDTEAQTLHAAALRYPSDYVQIEWWDLAEDKPSNPTVKYSTLDRAAAFVCSTTACSLPIFDARDIESAVHRSLLD